jgi:hypothetical protein
VLTWVVGAVVGWIVAAGLWSAFHPICIYRKSDQARVQIRGICVAMAMYESDTGSSPADGLLGRTDPVLGANRVLERICPAFAARVGAPSPRRRYLDVAPYEISAEGFLDPWGRPYRLRLRPLPPGPGVPASSVGIAVWSVGRNGIEENGDGDDVLEVVTREGRIREHRP